MADKNFRQAIALYESIGNSKLDDGRTIRDALCLDNKISLWDCLSAYLVLYRLPQCILDNQKKTFSFSRWLRPSMGSLAHFYDFVLFPPKFTNLGINATFQNDFDKNIFYLGFNEVQFRDVLRSIYEGLEGDSGSYQQIVLDSLRSQRVIKNHWNLCNYYSDEVLDSVHSSLSVLNSLKSKLQKAINPFRCKLTSGTDIDWSQLKREMSWLCNREIPRLIYYLFPMIEIVSKNHIDLMITADDADQRSKLASYVAREYGIPTLVVQQGTTTKNYPDWYQFAGDYVAAMSEKSREIINAQGVSLELIEVTGHPGHDKLLKSEYENLKGVDACKNDFIVLFASQPYVLGAFKSKAARRNAIRDACEAISSIKWVKLIVKAHPYESMLELRSILKNCKNIEIVGRDVEIAELIKSCSVFVTMFSQTTLEALYANKPVINVNFPNVVQTSLYYSGKATKVAVNRADLLQEIVEIKNGTSYYLTKEAQEEKANLLSKWAFKNDGLATDRIIALVKNIIK